MRIHLIVFSLLIGSFCFASNETFDSGDVVTCKARGRTPDTIELLDIFQTRPRPTRAPTTVLGAPNLSVEKKIAMALMRLEKVSPLRVQVYREEISQFWTEAELIPNVVLKDTPDTSGTVLASGCEIQQIASQRVPADSQEKRYSISKNLWSQLDNDSKAALIIHQVMFREALEYGIRSSRSTRTLNATLLTNQIPAGSLVRFFDFLTKAGFKQSDVVGCRAWIDDHGFSVFSDGSIQRIFLADDCALGGTPNLQAAAAADTPMLLYQRGYLKSFTPLVPYTTYDTGFTRVKALGGENCPVTLHPNRQLETFCIATDATFPLPNNQSKKVKKNSKVTLDPSGLLVSVTP
jgi:hypothetical protein